MKLIFWYIFRALAWFGLWNIINFIEFLKSMLCHFKCGSQRAGPSDQPSASGLFLAQSLIGVKGPHSSPDIDVDIEKCSRSFSLNKCYDSIWFPSSNGIWSSVTNPVARDVSSHRFLTVLLNLFP